MKGNGIEDGAKAIEKMTDGAWAPGGKSDVTVDDVESQYPPTFKLSQRQKKLRAPLVMRRAFDQKDIELTDTPDDETKKVIVQAFCKRHIDAEAKAMRSLTTAVRKLLKPLIPGVARSCFYFYPQLMLAHPGFLYTTTDGEVSVWVVPRIPIFLEKVDEMEVLREICLGDMSALDDKARRYDAKKRERDNEVKRVAAVLNEVHDGKPVTYLDILKEHPLYFDAMYRVITGRDLLEGVQTE